MDGAWSASLANSRPFEGALIRCPSASTRSGFCFTSERSPCSGRRAWLCCLLEPCAPDITAIALPGISVSMDNLLAAMEYLPAFCVCQTESSVRRPVRVRILIHNRDHEMSPDAGVRNSDGIFCADDGEGDPSNGLLCPSRSLDSGFEIGLLPTLRASRSSGVHGHARAFRGFWLRVRDVAASPRHVAVAAGILDPD